MQIRRLTPNDFIVKLQFRLSRIASYGLLGITKRLIKKMLFGIASILLLPLSVVMYSLSYRRVVFFIDRIGHLAIEPDTLVKAQKLGLIKAKRWFVLAPGHRVSNQHLLHYWEQYFTIYRSPLACLFLQCVSAWPFMRLDVSHFINNDKGSQWGYEINERWGDREPVLQISLEDREWGDARLAEMGLPQGAWFVGVHVREGGFSPVDEVLHAHRNGSINNLIPAIEEITRRGGWVIRLGDPTMKPLKQMPQVIDYAHHPLKSARLDIILCARARFILGNTSGVFLIGTAFGVPSALANMIPMPTLGFLKQDLSIPKLLWDRQKDRYLSFKEVMASPISTYRYASLYEKNKITVVENSPEDILALTVEMLDRLNEKYTETSEDRQRHAEYMSLYQPQHYSYGAVSKTSFEFLRHYKQLLAGDTQRE